MNKQQQREQKRFRHQHQKREEMREFASCRCASFIFGSPGGGDGKVGRPMTSSWLSVVLLLLCCWTTIPSSTQAMPMQGEGGEGVRQDVFYIPYHAAPSRSSSSADHLLFDLIATDRRPSAERGAGGGPHQRHYPRAVELSRQLANLRNAYLARETSAALIHQSQMEKRNNNEREGNLMDFEENMERQLIIKPSLFATDGDKVEKMAAHEENGLLRTGRNEPTATAPKMYARHIGDLGGTMFRFG